MNHCPGREQLVLLLAKRLDDPVREEVVGHVENCAACQQTLEELTGETDSDVLSEPNASGHVAPRPITEAPGACIGPYRLLEKIGEGGMGVVYIAEQEKPVRRRVALKIIKPGMDSDQVIARFEAERQALALMEHPGIARVFDAGTTSSGRPFFVMELINGIPITDYCDQARLTTPERLELFVPVCQAIQHAHQKGIIHRDVKPSNVLVTVIDGVPVPKVIDFGVAKAIDQQLTERTMFTQHGAIVGTLEYMSPEQAGLSALDIDTRSDIYALGVVLYELITGTTPLDRVRLRTASYAEILERIKDEEPPRPSTRLSESAERLASIAAARGTEPGRLTRAVRGDLDWIVIKALEKDRSRRYETASGFARDIKRYLDGDPVEACPPRPAYRLGKFARKHRASLITAGLFAVMLIAMSVISTWQAIRASTAEKQARFERDRALQAQVVAHSEAENATRSALESVAVRNFLEHDLLAAARPEDQEGGLGKDATIRQAVDAVRPRISAAFKDQPMIEAAVRSTLGVTYYYLGDYPLAIAEHERAVQLRNVHLGASHPDTLESRTNLAKSYLDAGRTSQATALAEETLELRTAQLGPSHPDILLSRNNLAMAYLSAGQAAEAIALHEGTLEHVVARYGSTGPETLACRANLAMAYLAAGRTAEAISLDKETLKLLTVTLGPAHAETLAIRNNLGQDYKAAGQSADAIALHKETLELAEAKLGPDHPHTLTSRNNLTEAYLAAGRTDDVVAMHKQTLDARERKLGPDHPDTLQSRNNLGAAYRNGGRHKEAAALLEETLELAKPKLGSDHPHTLIIRNNLAQAYTGAGRINEALSLQEANLRLALARFGPDNPNTLQSRNNLATAYESAGRTLEAIAIWEAMLPMTTQTFGRGHPNTLATMSCLARADESLGRWVSAEPLWRESAATRGKMSASADPGLAGDLARLGFNLLMQRQWTSAEPVLRDCLQIRESRQPDDWTTFDTRGMLGASLLGQRKYAEAESLIVGGYEGEKAREAQIPPTGKSRLVEAARRVVRLYDTWGKPESAADWRIKLSLGPELPVNPIRP